MNKIIVLLVIAFFANYLPAQEVIGTTGGVANGSAGSVSYTVGSVSYTVTNDGKSRATSGVQQYHYQISMVTALPDMENISLSVYPNPTKDNIVLKTQKLAEASYIIYSLNGKVLAQKKIVGDDTIIDFSDKAPTTYLLKVVQQRKEIKTFKIIKK